MFLHLFPLAAYGQNRPIKLDFRDELFEKVLKAIERQSDYAFIFDNNAINTRQRITAYMEETDIGKILDAILFDTQIVYKIINKKIILTPRSSQQWNTPRQEKGIRGVIIDEENHPLIGVNITVKGLNIGTISDMHGRFYLDISPDNMTLSISYVGYATQQVKARKNMRICMIEDVQRLNEVIVVGYGIQRKSDLTGSIIKVSADNFRNSAVDNAEQSLQGQAAGVLVVSNSGSPGSPVSVRIRGVGTVNDANQPLYVVDGIPVDNIDYLNPSDISSIEILKDASATAIYGSRASNGVVLVTTARGSSDGDIFRTQVKFDLYYGVQQAIRIPEMLDAEGYVELNRRAYLNNPNALHTDFRDPATFLGVVEQVTGSRSGTNWWDAVFHTGQTQNYNLNVSGGNQRVSYLASGSYYKNDGIVRFSGYERFTLRSNTDFRLTERINISTNINATNSNRHTIPENSLESGTVFGALTYDPTTPIYRHNYMGIPGWDNRLEGYNPDNKYSWFGTSKYTNKPQPYANAYRQGTLQNENIFRLVANIILDIEIFPGLVFKTNIGTDRRNVTYDRFDPEFFLDADEKNENTLIMKEWHEWHNWTWENTLNMTTRLGKHAISAVTGITMEGFNYQRTMSSKQGIPNNEKDQWVINAGTFNPVAEGNRSHYSMMSYLARINYGFDNRYLLTASIRSDGSSKFMKENRWSTFPSVSAGWRISQEDFFQDWGQNIISDIKIRAGWGQIGNQMGLGNNDYMNTISGNNDKKYVFGQNKTQYTGYSHHTMGNPSIKWETSEHTNFGLDLNFFNNKLVATFDYYLKNTRDMLLRIPLPRYLGYQNDMWSNQGKVNNKGLDIQLEWQERKNDFSYSLSGNISFIHNEVISLGNSGTIPGGNERIGDVTLTKEGWPIGSFYGWVVEGVFQNQEQIDASHMKDREPRPGDLIFKDVDNDGKLTDDDRVNLGSPIPKTVFGLNAKASYKNIDMSLLFQGQAGNKIFHMLKYYTHQKTGFFNAYADVFETSWRAPGTLSPDDPGNPSDTEFQINSDPRLNTKASSYYIENGSYLRLKNIQLGYTFPKKWLASAHISNLRVYVGAQNLFTFTPYKGLDPELGGDRDSRNPTNFGIDRSHYPQSRTYMMGLNMIF
ncbi:MAG: SusC/RagA family TonB-linked outer membrane protein [Tannerellaceae bacterium]|jgi:TonB-linked SusC/RagA family outer membrane protein|nr:SusC/RagA family TonB-linked outer membrane protein [Tannerellaceae bacterium]